MKLLGPDSPWEGIMMLALWVIVVISIMFLCGCTLTISADGSKSATIDGASLIEILATK